MSAESLRSPQTPLIGRDAELAEVTDALVNPACRLLAVVGPGGVGKTRLAIEVAAQKEAAFCDGVFFVDLQPVEANNFLSAIVDALPLTLSGRDSLQAQLFKYLHDKEMLLLLDNFEHLLKEATFLSNLLSRAASVKLLVTSREALNLQQEWIYPLHGLPVPPEPTEDDGPGIRATEYGAVQLFWERARRARPDFSLDDERRQVIRICRLVEGLPLALELAASWVRTLACTEIADEIEHNLSFLSRPLRDVPERHRSMQAVFDQTWALLSEEERRVFRRLSVFRGGFQREAAETVAGATLTVLSALVDKCMVRQKGRYHIHELLRQFGEEKLSASPDEAKSARQRHVAYYADFLHRRLDAINSLYQRQAALEILEEWDNVRAAWQRAVADGNVDAIGRAATTFFYFCQLRSRFLEGATALKAAVTRIEQLSGSKERDLTLAQLLNHEGWLRIRVGEFTRARKVLEQSLALHEEYDATPPPHMGTDSAVPLAIIAHVQGDWEQAIALGESARQAAEARGDKHNLAFAHYSLAPARLSQGNYDAAYRHAERATMLAREVGNRWFMAYPLIEWGNVARAMGNYEEAEQHYRASYTLKDEFDSPEGMAVTLSHLGEIAVLQERYTEATQLFERSRALYEDLNDRGGLATCLKGLGQVAHGTEDLPLAGRRFRRALRIAAEIQFWPLVCSIIVEVAALLKSLGRTTQAVALLTLVQGHPASQHETRREAQRRLNLHESQMAAGEFAAAVQQGAEWELERALAKLYSELAGAAEVEDDQVQGKQSLVEPLTGREVDVLQLLVKGYTNAEIAEELVLALGTVKWYASQIYGKLGVSNRTEAAARARELNLVS